MARDSRNRRAKPLQGKRASGGSKGTGQGRGQRRGEGNYNLPKKLAKNALTAPCPARGSHGSDCICKGTGEIKVIR